METVPMPELMNEIGKSMAQPIESMEMNPICLKQ